MAGWQELSLQQPGEHPEYVGRVARLDQQLLGVSTANAAPSGPVAITDDSVVPPHSPDAIGQLVARLPELAHGAEVRLAGLRSQLATLIEPVNPELPSYAEVRHRLRDAIDIKRDRRSYTLQVAVKSEDPAKASALTRSFTDAYLEMQVERKRNAVEHLASYLQERAETLGEKAHHSRSAMVAFMEETGLVDEGAQVSLDAQLTSLSTEAATAKARAIEASARAASLKEMKDRGTLDSAPSVLESPTIQRLKQTHAEALFRTAVSPVEIRSIEERISDEQERIVAGAMIEAESWTHRHELLNREMEEIRRLMVERRVAALELEDLSREAQSDEGTYRHALSEYNALATGEHTFLPDGS